MKILYTYLHCDLLLNFSSVSRVTFSSFMEIDIKEADNSWSLKRYAVLELSNWGCSWEGLLSWNLRRKCWQRTKRMMFRKNVRTCTWWKICKTKTWARTRSRQKSGICCNGHLTWTVTVSAGPRNQCWSCYSFAHRTMCWVLSVCHIFFSTSHVLC